jgi:DNA polymerase-1
MAECLFSDTLERATFSYDEQLWIYNALDNCITFEVHDKLQSHPGGFAYDMARTMQGPALTLANRGIRVNLPERDRLITELSAQAVKYEHFFSRLTGESFGTSANPRSPDQLKQLFYKTLGFPEITTYDRLTKKRKVTTNRDALEKLLQQPRAVPFVKLILAIRDNAKKLQVLKSGIRSNGRLHCSYHVAGTETGRWSSSESVFYDGTNLQNITDEMRRIFVPDPGKKLCQLDLAQAESVVVGFLSGDEAYKNAIRSGDLHTYVCRLVWPDLPWTGDNKADRKIAEQKYYRNYSYRDLAKRGGHGSNYGGSPSVLAIHLKVSLAVAERFQAAYFKAFPGIRRWHNSIQQQLAVKRYIDTPLGRRCHFPGRPSDSSVIKSAIAYSPQSTIGDVLNYGLYKVWQAYDYLGTNEIQLLLQVHDAIVFQYDPAQEAEIIPRVQRMLATPILINGDVAEIKSDAQVGWNWGKVKTSDEGATTNGYGLVDYKGADARVAPQEVSPLDRRVCDIHQPFK